MGQTSLDLKNIVDKIIKILINILVVFVCLIAFFLLYYIISAQIHSNDENYKPSISLYTIVSPSMDPVIKVYDVVVNKKVKSPNEISVGDIITYVSTNPTSEGMTITHRVIEVEGSSEGQYAYRTQGDNNSAPDATYVTFDNVIGKEIIIIPSLGKLQFLLANKKGWLFLLLIPIGIYILKDIYKLIELYGLRRKVDEVAGIIEEPDYVKKRHEKERKERLRNELKKIESKGDKYLRSEFENNGFLEPYSENIITVGEVNNTTIEAEQPKEQPNEEKCIKQDISFINKQSLIKKEEKTKEVKEKNVSKTQSTKKERIRPILQSSDIEILDTDELSSIIKKYTEKIAQLDEAIQDLEENKKIAAAKKQEEKNKKETFVEHDDYLNGEKIKVVSIESAKKHRPKAQEEKQVEIEKIEIKSASLYNKPKPPIKKMERPESVDIKSLNINEVKEIKEASETKPVLESTKPKKELNLNPNNIKKVNRTNQPKPKPKKKKIVSKKPSHNKYHVQNTKKNKFIRLEKVK